MTIAMQFIMVVANGQISGTLAQFGTAGSDSANAVVSTLRSTIVGGTTTGNFDSYTNLGGTDCFVRKFDSSGAPAWTRQFGTSGNDQLLGIEAIGENTYVVGSTDSAFSGQSSSGQEDAFLAKLDSLGNVVWIKQFGTVSRDVATGIRLVGGALYVVGYTKGSMAGQTSKGGYDAFLKKFDTAGNEQFTVQFGTDKDDIAYSVDGLNSMLFVGGGTKGVFPANSNKGNQDAFIRALDSKGTEIWTAQTGTIGDDECRGIAVSSQPKAVYCAGSVGGVLPQQNGSGLFDAFAWKLDTSGKEVWIKQLGGMVENHGYSLAVSNTGVTVGGVVFGALPTCSWAGDADAFIWNLDSSGKQIAISQFGTTNQDSFQALSNSPTTSIAVGLTGGTLSGKTTSGGQDVMTLTTKLR